MKPVNAPASSDRAFGLVFAAVFLVVALYPLLDSGGARAWSLGVSASFLLIAIVAPRLLAPLNRAWFRFGLLLHAIVSPVALGIIFFLVVTPMGLLARLFGKVPLALDFEPSKESYWVRRTPPGPAPDSLDNQF